MKINRNKLIDYIKNNHLSMIKFVEDLGWDLNKFIKMLFNNGQLDEESAKHFIDFVGAENALKIINWRAMNVARPKYRTIFQPDYAY